MVSSCYNIVGFLDSNYVDNHANSKYTFVFYTFVGGKLASWRTKKKTFVARSSGEVEYRALTQTICDFHQDFFYKKLDCLLLYLCMCCDIAAIIFLVANNSVFYKRIGTWKDRVMLS